MDIKDNFAVLKTYFTKMKKNDIYKEIKKIIIYLCGR